MGLTWRGDNDKLNLCVRENLFDGAMDDNAFHRLLSEAGLDFASRGSGIAFHDGMEGEQMGLGEDERHMEGKATEANSNDAGLDRCHGLAVDEAV